MSNTQTDINYQEFVKYIHQSFESEISVEGINEILYLNEGYNKDSPASLGKSLLLTRVLFSGKKISGEEYKYDQRLYPGINAWIADNHKGKSTIFKIIKFALTGVDSIKRDIQPWIDEILLEFKIGKVTYTSYIDRTGRDRGALYRSSINEFIKFRNNQKLDSIDNKIEFKFKSKTQLEEKLQDFFFDQFSFYTLKYTQKSSSKEDFDLNTANLSWATYFKSIYLESSNYEYLFFDNEKFGSQGKKIFEMILGLPLTYPINMLSLQHDRILEAIGKIKFTDKSTIGSTQGQKMDIEKRLDTVSKELGVLARNKKITFDEKPLVEEYNQIQSVINNSRKEERSLNEIYQSKKSKLSNLENEVQNLKSDKKKIEKEIVRLEKHKLNIDLYKDTESFFSNLEIKSCPHCEVDISKEKKKSEAESHICSLCGETSTQQKVEEEEILEKLTRIKAEKEGYSAKLKQIQEHISQQQESILELKESVQTYYSQLTAIPSIDSKAKRLKEIEIRIEEINKERYIQKDLLERKENLIKEEAVLNFQLAEIEKEKSFDSSEEMKELILKKYILDKALQALKAKRIHLNKNILSKLEALILNEVHAFGLTSIKQIEINEKYDLVFTQNEIQVIFADLTEGEKLRVKLAFYLSLIQLDIEHNLGRHPRFLIFDSPGSEEMVPKHLHGLSDILKNVNERFKDKLQIFIGSALREFSQITDSEKAFIKVDDEFVF